MGFDMSPPPSPFTIKMLIFCNVTFILLLNQCMFRSFPSVNPSPQEQTLYTKILNPLLTPEISAGSVMWLRACLGADHQTIWYSGERGGAYPIKENLAPKIKKKNWWWKVRKYFCPENYSKKGIPPPPLFPKEYQIVLGEWSRGGVYMISSLLMVCMCTLLMGPNL